MTASKARRSTLGAAALALALALFSAAGGAGAVTAHSGGGTAVDGATIAPPGPSATREGPAITDPAGDGFGGDPAPAAGRSFGGDPGPAGDPVPADQSAPASGAGPAPPSGPPGVDVSLAGEAYAVQQDATTPSQFLLGRYPRATVDASRDLTTAFGSFADPGSSGRSAVEEAVDPAGDPNVTAPTWAECAFPVSPEMPAEDARSPGQGASLTAVARCHRGAAQAAGYFLRDPGPRPTGGIALLRAWSAAATVDATSNAAGATFTSSYSAIEDVNLAGTVTFSAITNRVNVATSGHPGGASVETLATVAGMTIGGTPVELPSDSLEELAPLLAQLPPILSSLGTLTFDVLPEETSATTDGTQGFGRAAQLVVTLENGQNTFRFGLGFASAQARTVLDRFAAPTPGVPPFHPGAGVRPPRPTLQGFVQSFGPGSQPSHRAPVASRPRTAPGGPGAAGTRPPDTLNLLPPPQPPSDQFQGAGGSAAYGGSGPWLALIGGSVIGLALARYLAYSRAARPVPA